MREKQLAICDKDEQYLDMLQAYLLKKKPAGFDILVFGSIRQAITASKEERFEILLIGEHTYTEEVADINALKIFILQEDGLSGIKGYTFLSKYQSMEALIRQALDEFALDEACASAVRCGKNRTRLISFYSPSRHSGQTLASLCAGELLADWGKKVLYLNLSAFSGFEELLRTTYHADITDFMYFVLKHSDKLLYKLEGMKHTIHGVDYLPPALDYADLLELDAQDWQNVLDTLLYSGDYTHIIIDLTEVCQGFYHIMERSDRIYLVNGRGTAREQAMFHQYQNLLLGKECGEIIDKTTILELQGNWELQEIALDQLSVSELGAYMKRILQKYENA